jgi:hypothetical protein
MHGAALSFVQFAITKMTLRCILHEWSQQDRARLKVSAFNFFLAYPLLSRPHDRIFGLTGKQIKSYRSADNGDKGSIQCTGTG